MASKFIQEGASGDEPMGAINVTSLVDVMFCLLIMFMVATPLMSPDMIPMDLPGARGEEITEEEFLYQVVSIDKDGKVFLGVLPLSEDKDKMAQELSTNVKVKDGDKVFVQGDENVPYERIVDVLVALKQANVSSVGFVSDPSRKRSQESE
ncbi:MAG: biopolymer transporter ExbD [Nannocystaceae bacterium]|nr:biopolymer transporter ExbD [Nannocystaceae bacterium]